MKNIEQYKKRFYNLIESTIGDVRPILTEGITVNGRHATINSNGTVTILDKNGNPSTIRMYVKIAGLEKNINVKDIQALNAGYLITGQTGASQFVDKEKISQVIQFVDYNTPYEIESDSWSTPNLFLKKV